MKIKKLPNILALHLKRFKYQEDVQKYIKLSYRVAFPLELRLFNTVDDAENPDRLYELFAVVVHIGSGPHHGHYVTLVKGPLSWLLFDDDKIETLRESEIPKYFGDSPCGSAYVLYYQAVDIDLPSLGLKPETFAAAAAVASTLTNGAADTPSDTVDSVELTPALPPGLVSADAGSETSHSSPLVGTPSPVFSGIPPKISLPALRVDPVSIPSEQPTSPTGSAGRRSDKNQHLSQRLVNGIRTSAEEMIIAASNEGPRRSSSKERSPRRPSTAPAPQSPLGKLRGKEKEDTTPVPPVPALPHVLVNGREAKEKEPDRKPGLWFKRRGLKPEKDKDKKDKLCSFDFSSAVAINGNICGVGAHEPYRLTTAFLIICFTTESLSRIHPALPIIITPIASLITRNIIRRRIARITSADVSARNRLNIRIFIG
ncbi:hypothetical protein EWM64_g9752 [Hericium alpestre]|uniref:ubiquitinyl hydrolase 1 n=1 Tax=Hericium alpestre TaxID=135208 RepID=A0A4Y9ZJA3_9AGAM|nr:hypothetical protein EWM64_g9752 [Hericium alpestre]